MNSTNRVRRIKFEEKVEELLIGTNLTDKIARINHSRVLLVEANAVDSEIMCALNVARIRVLGAKSNVSHSKQKKEITRAMKCAKDLIKLKVEIGCAIMK